jgi:hypothetical protein
MLGERRRLPQRSAEVERRDPWPCTSTATAVFGAAATTSFDIDGWGLEAMRRLLRRTPVRPFDTQAP